MADGIDRGWFTSHHHSGNGGNSSNGLGISRGGQYRVRSRGGIDFHGHGDDVVPRIKKCGGDVRAAVSSYERADVNPEEVVGDMLKDA